MEGHRLNQQPNKDNQWRQAFQEDIEYIGIQWEDLGNMAMESLIAQYSTMWPDLIMVKYLQSKKLHSLYIKAYHLS